MLKHFVFCDAHIQSCSHQQSCGYWSGIFGEVFLRGSCSPGIQTKLMSWSQKHLVIPIRRAWYRQQLYDTFCLSAVAIIYMYVSYIFLFFHCKVCPVSFGVVSQTEDVEACPQLEELDRYGQHLFLGLSCSGEKHIGQANRQRMVVLISRKSLCKVEHQVSSSSWIFFIWL